MTPFSHTNRKGVTFYLHERRSKNGKPRYVFARDVGEGALGAVPEGYEVTESVASAVVSLVKCRARVLLADEEESVRRELAALGLTAYRVEASEKDKALVVFEPERLTIDLEALSPFGLRGGREDWLLRGRYLPVVRFVLDDAGRRGFHVERMTYRGDGGWSWPLGHGDLDALAKKVLPHLGKESFFNLR